MVRWKYPFDALGGEVGELGFALEASKDAALKPLAGEELHWVDGERVWLCVDAE